MTAQTQNDVFAPGEQITQRSACAPHYSTVSIEIPTSTIGLALGAGVGLLAGGFLGMLLVAPAGMVVASFVSGVLDAAAEQDAALNNECYTPDTSMCALKATQEELQLAGEELHRMADEGGISPTKKQAKQADQYLHASHQIKEVLPVADTVLPLGSTKKSAS